MARLGELLVAAGLLTATQVEQALRAQVMWGARLGTNLIELGYLDLDTLSKTLGRQRRMPAALARHFEKADPAVQRLLSAEMAERYLCVPLLRSGPQQLVVLATVAPIPKRDLAIIGQEMAIEPALLIPSLAAELRIRYQLEHVYRIPRETRFLRARGRLSPVPPTELILVPPEPDLELPPAPGTELPVAPTPPTAPLTGPADPDLAASELDGDTLHDPVLALHEEEVDDLSSIGILDDDDDLGGPTVRVDDRDRRRYVRTIADGPATESRSLGRIALRKVAAPRPGASSTLGEATREIRRGTDRDGVADLVVSAIFRFARSCESAMLLVIRGDVAISWKGFCRSGSTVPDIAVPIDQPGLIPGAILHSKTQRSAVELTPIDRLLMVSLGQETGELVVVPITIAGQVMCLLAMVTAHDAKVSSVESVAAAAGAAFARLMRDSGR